MLYNMKSNIDCKTVAGFGDEWTRFDQSNLNPAERNIIFNKYFKIFPWSNLPPSAEGYDMGCGSGRWAKLVAPKVGKLHCIDPSSAIKVAIQNLKEYKNCQFHTAGVGDKIFADNSMDFGYSLGVLHHVPDTQDGINQCVRYLKPGAPLLIYLYYRFDNRSRPYRWVWQMSEVIRFVVSRSPHSVRYLLSQFFAASIYYPLAKIAKILEKLGINAQIAEKMPLGMYRNLSFYTMRTDALDRLGTRLEKRFTKDEIASMMNKAGLSDIKFSDNAPFWCAVGIKNITICAGS
jgi:ubiquinone/menaquinone biosynthesis C-methylase UbiE